MEVRAPRLIPVPDWNKHHLWPPLGGLRWLIFHAKEKVLRRFAGWVLGRVNRGKGQEESHEANHLLPGKSVGAQLDDPRSEPRGHGIGPAIR
jgi:hypothetical protein